MVGSGSVEVVFVADGVMEDLEEFGGFLYGCGRGCGWALLTLRASLTGGALRTLTARGSRRALLSRWSRRTLLSRWSGRASLTGGSRRALLSQ